MSKIGSTTPLAAAQSGSLLPLKSGEAGADAGLFAGIFMLLNTKSGEGAETAGAGLPAMADIMASNNPEDGQPSKERPAEETAAIITAMIEPMPEMKTARGTAAQIDKDILPKDLDIAIAEDLKSGQVKQGVLPVKAGQLNLPAASRNLTDFQPAPHRTDLQGIKPFSKVSLVILPADERSVNHIIWSDIMTSDTPGQNIPITSYLSDLLRGFRHSSVTLFQRD